MGSYNVISRIVINLIKERLMKKIVISLCLFCGLFHYVFGGLKEDIENGFKQCATLPQKDGFFGDRKIVDCFRKFMKSYSDILIKQCENDKIHECLMIFNGTYNLSGQRMLFESVAYLKNGNLLTSNVFNGKDGENAMLTQNFKKRLLKICEPGQCYEIAKAYDTNKSEVNDFLEKACSGGIADACYVIGK